MTKGQQAIRDLAGAMLDLTSHVPELTGNFPDYAAPIVRTGNDGIRELAMARWGMPSPVFALQGKKVDRASPTCATPAGRTGVASQKNGTNSGVHVNTDNSGS